MCKLDETRRRGPRDVHRFAADAVSDAASGLSFWPQVRDDPELGPDEALCVLATRSHLDRFPPEDLDRGVVGALDALIARDAPALVDRLSRLTFVDDWLAEAEQLDESWDWIAGNDAADEANLVAARLFLALDRFSLACHAGRKIVRDDTPGECRAGLEALEGEVDRGERLLRERPGVFAGAAALVAAQLEQFRTDLLDLDEPLWTTTIKHQLLHAAVEGRDGEPGRDVAPDADGAA